jgi:glucokinase
MYIELIPNRNSPPAVLLRESFREDGKVKKRTLANLSKLPSHVVEGIKMALTGSAVPAAEFHPI